MKALVLAAGWGTRLRPFTYTLPKHLLPVAGKPLIIHVLEMIAAAGMEEVGIVVSPTTLELFRDALGAGRCCGLTYILQVEAKGLAHAVLCAEGFVEKDDCLVVLGDNLFGEGVEPVLERFREEKTHVVALKEVEDPRRFGVAVLEGTCIRRVVEKPPDPPSNWAIAGVYAFKSSVFAAARSIKPSARGELEITDAIQILIDEGERVLAHCLQGWWQDVGRPEDLIAAQELLSSRISQCISGEVEDTEVHGHVVVEKGAVVHASHLVGPVWLGPEVKVRNATVGPNVSLEAGVEVQDAEIRESIVMEGARVFGSRLFRSVIGRRAQVSGKGRASLFLGDAGRVVLTGGQS